MKKWRGWINKLVEWRSSRLHRGRKFQEELDILKLALCTSARNIQLQNYNETRRYDEVTLPSNVEQLLLQESDRLAELSKYQVEDLLTKNIRSQVNELMDFVVKTKGKDPYPTPKGFLKKEEKEGQQHLNGKYSFNKMLEQLNRMSAFDAMDRIRELEIEEKQSRHPLGNFSIGITRSSIDHPDAGFGVTVRGHCGVGTVIGFYPGVIHFPHTLSKEVYEGNDYLFSRYDGVVVDGRVWEHMAAKARRTQHHFNEMQGDLSSQPENSDQFKKYCNPYGIGNYINHPPMGVQPNVLAIGYDFKEKYTKPNHVPFIPNVNGGSAGLLYDIMPGTIMRSVALITTVDVCDEELFLNYRFNPNNPYPVWYTQPDEEECKRRWS